MAEGPGLGEVYLNYVGKRTYGPKLFLQEAMTYLEFNRAVGNRPVPLGSYILFAQWTKKGAQVFALGKVTGYSFLATGEELKQAFASLTQLERQLQQNPDPKVKEDLEKLSRLLAKLYDSILKGETGASGELYDRGCGSYIEIVIDYDPKDFYELMVLYMRYFGKLPFSYFVRGTIIAYTLDKEKMLNWNAVKFARGLIKLKMRGEDWKHIMTNWEFVDIDVKEKVALLKEYKQLKGRKAEERKLLLEILRDKAREKGGKDVLSD